MPKGPTKPELEKQVAEQHSKIDDLTAECVKMAEQLQASQDAVAAAQAELTAALEAAATSDAAHAALQAQLDEATAAAANAGQAPLGDQGNMAMIPRPLGSSWPIRESMQVTKPEYAEIQRTIRNLVIRATLDWTDDFRHLDPDKLAQLFRAAHAAHPILQRYANNWATAAIARQYMQNKRKHAYKQGYISKRRAHQVGNRENVPVGHRNRINKRDES